MPKRQSEAENERMPGAADERAAVQSVVIAANVLKALAAQGGILPLKGLAKATGMPRGKVHRYLASLRRAGLVAQNAETGHYYIASAAVMIGLVGLGRINPVRQLQEALPGLRDRVNATVTAAIWGERGPTIIAIEESDHLVTMNIRIGSVLPVLTTAIGRLFLAYLPAAMTRQFIVAERKRFSPRVTPPGQDLEGLLQNIRGRQLSQAHGVLIPGIDAIAAPVFDHRARIVGVICVVGHSDAKITQWDGVVAKELANTASALSDQLGSSGQEAISPSVQNSASELSRSVATPKLGKKGRKHEPGVNS